jgi:hypothetical protein
MPNRFGKKLNCLLAAGAVALLLLAAQPAAAALADWAIAPVSAGSPGFSVFAGQSAASDLAIEALLADVLEQAKAELAAASAKMGLGISIDPPAEELPAQPSPRRDDRLPEILVPGSGNSSSCGGASVSGNSSAGSAQPAAAFFGPVTPADAGPRGRLPREASLQFSSNSLRPPTPPPRS